MNKAELEFLPWDSDFFGFKTGRIVLPDLDPMKLKHILNAAEKEKFRLIYWAAENTPEIMQCGLENGGVLADNKTTFFKELTGKATIATTGSQISSFESLPIPPELSALAIQAGKYSRFNSDSRFPKRTFRSLFEKWIEESVNRQIAEKVLVWRDEKQIVRGFVTLGRKMARGDIGLIAVDETFRGQGIGRNLVQEAQNYFTLNSIRQLQVITQGANTAACKLYEKCGFIVEKVVPFFHFWINQ